MDNNKWDTSRAAGEAEEMELDGLYVKEKIKMSLRRMYPQGKARRSRPRTTWRKSVERGTEEDWEQLERGQGFGAGQD